jgi:hypothetical protein
MKTSAQKKISEIKVTMQLIALMMPMINDRARGVHWAFAAVMLPDSSGYGIGQAVHMQYGYFPVTELAGCSWDEACKVADDLNHSIGISREEAARIACTTLKRRSYSQPVGGR